MSHQEPIEGAGKPLTRANRDDLLFSIKYAMLFDGRGKPHGKSRELAADILADIVVRHLEKSNFIVMQGPPSPGHSTNSQPRIPMKD